MNYDPSAVVQALVDSAPRSLLKADQEAVRSFVEAGLLRHHERRPFTWLEFAKTRPDAHRVLPLVYDRPSRLIFVGGSGEHQQLCAMLYHFRQLDESALPQLHDLWSTISRKASVLADTFILEGMGMRVGGPSAQMGRRTLMVGESCRMSADELTLFSAYERMWIS